MAHHYLLLVVRDTNHHTGFWRVPFSEVTVKDRMALTTPAEPMCRVFITHKLMVDWLLYFCNPKSTQMVMGYPGDQVITFSTSKLMSIDCLTEALTVRKQRGMTISACPNDVYVAIWDQKVFPSSFCLQNLRADKFVSLVEASMGDPRKQREVEDGMVKETPLAGYFWGLQRPTMMVTWNWTHMGEQRAQIKHS